MPTCLSDELAEAERPAGEELLGAQLGVLGEVGLQSVVGRRVLTASGFGECVGYRASDATYEVKLSFGTSFVAMLDEGGLAGVETLNLDENAISEQGMQELAAAIARGGLPSCTYIALDGNPGSVAPVAEAAKQRGGRQVYSKVY